MAEAGEGNLISMAGVKHPQAMAAHDHDALRAHGSQHPQVNHDTIAWMNERLRGNRACATFAVGAPVQVV